MVDTVAVVVVVSVGTLALGAGVQFASGGCVVLCAVVMSVLLRVLLLWLLCVWLLCWLRCCVVLVGVFPSVVEANHDDDFDVVV